MIYQSFAAPPANDHLSATLSKITALSEAHLRTIANSGGCH
jgi:hypothetical protein